MTWLKHRSSLWDYLLRTQASSWTRGAASSPDQPHQDFTHSPQVNTHCAYPQRDGQLLCWVSKMVYPQQTVIQTSTNRNRRGEISWQRPTNKPNRHVADCLTKASVSSDFLFSDARNKFPLLLKHIVHTNSAGQGDLVVPRTRTAGYGGMVRELFCRCSVSVEQFATGNEDITDTRTVHPTAENCNVFTQLLRVIASAIIFNTWLCKT